MLDSKRTSFLESGQVKRDLLPMATYWAKELDGAFSKEADSLIHVGNPARELMRKMTLVFFRYIHSYPRSYQIMVQGKRFIVSPGVFTPSFLNVVNTKASELLATNLKVPTGGRVLDLGTGIGIQGIFAAERAGSVVATDINPVAAGCAAENARINNVANLTTRTGDLFEPVRGEKFDLIIWLPPAFFVEPRTIPERAFACGRGGEILIRFCREAANHLSKDGFIQVSCVDRTRQLILHHLSSNGFSYERIKMVRRLPMETCRQYLAWRR